MFGIKEVKAHCDIPCKIYDPATAQIATLSVIRLLDLIHEVGDSVVSAADTAKIVPRLSVPPTSRLDVVVTPVMTFVKLTVPGIFEPAG